MGSVQISVKLDDKPGSLAEFTKMLNDSNIHIRSITVSQIPGLVLFLVDKTDECIQLLKEKGYEFTAKDVIAVLLPNNPSSSLEIEHVAEVLGTSSVNIDFLYSTHVKNSHLVIIHVDDSEKARQVLKDKGIYLCERDFL